MKKAYKAPKLNSFGNAKELTQATGGAPQSDATIVNGNPLLGLNQTGSNDVIVNTTL